MKTPPREVLPIWASNGAAMTHPQGEENETI
jgi:hypothetical protein